MKFSVYVRKELAEKITQLSKSLKRTRSSVINQALEEWLKKQDSVRPPKTKRKQWPEHFFDFKPVLEGTRFYRIEKNQSV